MVHGNSLARTAYSDHAAPTRTARDTEYDLFARITLRLRAAQGAANAAGRSADPGSRAHSAFPELVAALHDNLRLWTVVAADVAEEANGLPAPLRARLFYLAEFTRARTREILGGRATADALVDINTMVMRGLRSEGEGR